MAGGESKRNTDPHQNTTTTKKSLTIDVLLVAGKVNRLDAANLLGRDANGRASGRGSGGADSGASNRVGGALLEGRGDQLAGQVGAHGLLEGSRGHCDDVCVRVYCGAKKYQLGRGEG